MDIARLRADTPACAELIHLNNAGAGLMPEPVAKVIRDHLDLECRIGGYEASDLRDPEVQAAYRAVADLLGTAPRNIAMTEHATASYTRALSAVPFEAGDIILTTRNDYISNQIQFLSMQTRLGIQIVRTPDLPEGGVDAAAMRALIRQHWPKLVCVTHVPTSSGLVQDVAAVGIACREAGVLYLVDACQSVGQMPVDVCELHCDFLSATSRKFLRGPRGAGFLYVSDRVLADGLEPLYLDMRGADWVGPDRYQPAATAQRFENWEFAYALLLGTGEAARYALAIGLSEIRERVVALSARLRRGLAAIDGVRVLDRGPVLSGTVTVWVDGWQPEELVAALRTRHVNTSAQFRSFAVFDFDEKGVAGAVRLSPHYYNTEDEIDRATDIVAELTKSRQR